MEAGGGGFQRGVIQQQVFVPAQGWVALHHEACGAFAVTVGPGGGGSARTRGSSAM